MATIIQGSADSTFGGTIESTGIDDNATSTAITINSSEDVGIGVTPESWSSVYEALQIGDAGALVSRNNNNYTELLNNAYNDGSWKYINTDTAQRLLLDNDGKYTFMTTASGSADAAITWTTAMTIDGSGNVLVGTTDSQPSGNNVNGIALRADNTLEIAATTTSPVRLNRKGNNGDVINFLRGTTAVGSVSITTTATAYNTSSDYRLKENVVPMTGSIDRLKELNPSRFNFIIDANKTVDGFLAHEAQEVVPEAISGTKDAMRTEEYEVEPAIEATYDEEGNELTPAVEAVMGEREVEDYQGIDQSKLVPLLTSALQEAVAKIEELTTRIETLENA